MKSVIVFVVGGILFGAFSLGAGYLALGDEVWTQGGAAFGLAFVPAAVTLAWVLYSYRTSPEMQLLATLGGSGVRMAIALGGGLFLTQTLSQTFDKTFWLWLALFYLTFLAFEMTLVVWQQPSGNGSTQGAPK